MRSRRILLYATLAIVAFPHGRAEGQQIRPYLQPVINVSGLGRVFRLSPALGAGFGAEVGVRFSSFTAGVRISRTISVDNSNYSPFINPDGETRSRRYTGTAHDGVSEIGGRLSVQPRKSLPITLSVGGGYERKTESPFVSGAIGFVTGTSVRLHVDAELTRYAVYYEDNTVIEESGHITFATVNGYGTEWAKRNAISTSIEVPIGH